MNRKLIIVPIVLLTAFATYRYMRAKDEAEGARRILASGTVEATDARLGCGAAARLDILQLLEQIVRALACEFREVRCGTVSVGTVASTTDGDLFFSCFCISSRVGDTGDAKGQQQTHEYFVHQLIQLRLRV